MCVWASERGSWRQTARIETAKSERRTDVNRDIAGFLEEQGRFTRLLNEYQKSYDYGLQRDESGRAGDRRSLLADLDALEADALARASWLDDSVRGERERLRNIAFSVESYEGSLDRRKLDRAKRKLSEQQREKESRHSAASAFVPAEAGVEIAAQGPDGAPSVPMHNAERICGSRKLRDLTKETIASMERISGSKLPEPLAKAADFLNLRAQAYAEVATKRQQLDDLLSAASQELDRDLKSGQATIDAATLRRVAELEAKKSHMDASRDANRQEYFTQLKKLLVDGLEDAFVGDTIYAHAEEWLTSYLGTYSDGCAGKGSFDAFLVGIVRQAAAVHDDGTLDTFLGRILPTSVYAQGSILLPVVLPRYPAKPICLSYFSEHVDGVYPLFSNYALQIMRLFDAEAVSTYLVDCSNVGGKYAAFSTYESSDEEKRVCVVRTQEELTGVLAELSEYVIESNSTYLKNAYTDVEDYNIHSAIKREVKALFVSNLSELGNGDVSTLTTLARNGCRCGVLVFIGVSTDEFQASGVITQQHAAAVNTLAGLCDRMYMDSQGNLGFGNGLPALSPPPAIGDAVAARIVEHAVANSGRQTVIPLGNHLAQGGAILSGDCRRHLVIPVGRTPQGDEYALDLHKDAACALIGGNPSAGKSSLLHTVILQCITRYKPEDLEIYIADFKDGSEFNVYANVGVKSVKAVLDDSEEDLATSFLVFVKREIERRLSYFKELSDKTGTSVRDIEEFYHVNGETGGLVPHIPRMLLIIDEFQSLYTGNRSTGELTNWIVRMGRTAGIFLIMSSQRSQADSSAMSSSFGGQTKEYFIYRLMFKLPYSGAKEIMSDRCSDTGRENPALRKAQTLMPGQVIINPNMGATEEDNQLIQCYYPSSELIDKLCGLIVREQGRNDHTIVLASEKVVDSVTRPASAEIVLGESNRFHADGEHDDDAFSDDTYVTLDPNVGALGVYGISEKGYASVLQSCWLALRDRDAACVVLGTDRGAQALAEVVDGMLTIANEDEFATVIGTLRGEGRFVLACIVNPYEFSGMCRDSLGRSGKGVELAEDLTRDENAFLVVCADSTKKLKDKATWCDSAIPCRVLLAGNPANIRLAVTSDAADRIKDGPFNVIRSNVLKAYYYNKDTNKLGRMRLYPAIERHAASSRWEAAPGDAPVGDSSAQHDAEEGYAGLVGN